MVDLKEIIICPDCKKEFSFEAKSINCPLCGKTFSLVDGIITVLAEEKASFSPGAAKKEIIRKIKRRLLHPTFNFPFSYLTRKKSEQLYERYLNDKTTARQFRRTYLPPEYHNREGLVLDFGCGRGRHCAMLSQCGFDIIGVEPEPYDNGYWEKIPNAKFIKAKEGSLSFFKDEIFDLCLCMQVLTYIKDDQKVLKDLNQLLRKEGFLILQVTNKDNFRTLLTKKWLADEPLKRYYTIQEIKSLLELNGFIVRSIWTEKLYFPFFTHFFGFVFEILLPQKMYDFLSKLTPARYRGLINILAQKC